MSVVGEIFATWRHPDGPVGRLLSAGPREDRSLMILIVAAVFMFIARTPDLARRAALNPEVPLQAQMGITLFVMLFLIPIMAYAVAMISHWVMQVLGRDGAAYGARVALFWAMLAVVPGLLLHGLLSGIVGGEAAGTRMVGLAVFVAFLWFWGRGLHLAYRMRKPE